MAKKSAEKPAAELRVEYLPLADLLPYARNSRTHDEAQVAQIAASIREFGFTNPILISEGCDIIAGHGRALAAAKLGLTLVPTIRLGHLTETQRRAYVIADNRLALNAGWDSKMLSLELLDLKTAEFDLELLGFEDKELAKLLEPTVEETEGLTDPDEVPENAETRCKPGDLWILGKHRLLCGDSTNVQHVERLMGGDKADMVWTDPPYNVALGMNETPEQAAKRNRRTDGLVVMNDKMSDGDFRQFLFDVFKNVAMVMRPGGAFYVAHADSEGYNFRGAVRDAGLLLKQCLIWVKSSLVMGRQDYQWRHEPILYGWADGAAHAWHSDRKQSTVLEFDKPSRNGEHPTMKPVELVAYCIGNSSRGGESVLDLFGGSGTTMIAAEKLGRASRLMELDPKYCSVIIERWCRFTGKMAYRLDDDGTQTPWNEVAAEGGQP